MRTQLIFLLVLPCLLAGLSGQVIQNRWVSLSGSDTNTGMENSPWRTVTHAVDASPTGTAINVGPGTFGTAGFLEGIDINSKGLVVRGAGIGKTIIKGHAGFSRSIIVNGVTETWNAVFICRDGNNLSAFDMTIDADHVVAPRVATVIYTNAGWGKLIRCELKGAGAVTPNSAADHIGFFAAGRDNANSSHVRLSHCLIHGFNQAGVRMFGGGLTGVIESCMIRGAGMVDSPGVAQCGIQFGVGGRSFSVTNSVIRDLWYSPSTGPTGGDAVGIKVTQSRCTTDLRYNRILTCEVGISHDAPINGDTPIKHNSVANCGIAVRVLSDRATATDNHFDALTSVHVANGRSFSMSGNSYSDFRTNLGYPTKYVAANSITAQDVSPNKASKGFGEAAEVSQGSAGATPRAVVTGDFNGDGIIDFACVNPGRKVVRVHLGSGGPDFTTLGVREIPVSGVPLYCVAGEFSGTAGLDLAVINDQGLVILFGNKGNGYFTSLSALAIPSLENPTSIQTGDIDQADQADLVIGYAGSSTTNGGVAVMHVKNGALSVGATIPGTFRTVTGVGLAHLDTDSRIDLFVIDASNSLGVSDKLHVLRHSSTVGTFSAAVSYAIGKNGHSTDSGDLDGDGDNDIVVTTNGDPGSVHVFENNGSGVMTEATHSPFQVPADAQAVRIADLQGDSDFDTDRIDVMVCHPQLHKITSLFNYRDGSFEDFRGMHTNLAPMDLALADVNRDRLLDLMVANFADDTVSVFLAVPDALAQHYGAGCRGTGDLIPIIEPDETLPMTPAVGNLDFAVAVRDALPNTSVVLLLSAWETATVPKCGLLGGRIFFWTVRTSDSYGTATIGMPIPNIPKYGGFDFYAQYVSLDPSGRFLGNYALSRPMRFRIGL